MALIEEYEVHGLRVRVDNTRQEIRTEHVLQRLAAALDLIAARAPRVHHRLRTDVAGLVVERFACRGAYFPMTRECLVELTFTVNPRHTLAEIAASIVHEATHARVATWCGPLPPECRPREERLCRRAELEFGLALPDGAIVVQRALDALGLTEDEVAPVVDWEEAARRVARVDDDARRADRPPAGP